LFSEKSLAFFAMEFLPILGHLYYVLHPVKLFVTFSLCEIVNLHKYAQHYKIQV